MLSVEKLFFNLFAFADVDAHADDSVCSAYGAFAVVKNASMQCQPMNRSVRPYHAVLGADNWPAGS